MNATLEHRMPDDLLWPPLDDVRRALGVAVVEGADVAALPEKPAASPDFSSRGLSTDLPEPLRSLVERRAGLAALLAPENWSPGDIVGLPDSSGNVLGVLLDEPDTSGACGSGRIWRGWLTAAELDWAGANDVLLEPGDEPFDPAVGVVQAWNRVQVEQTTGPLLGRLSAARLAAVRAVQDEAPASTSSGVGAIDVRPGQIGLRAAGGFTVLTGTPLGADDQRNAYRALYRAAAQRLSVLRAAEAAVPVRAVSASLRQGWQRMVQRWWADVPGRIVVAGLCVAVLALIGQGGYFLPASTPVADDEIRFRSMPAPQPRAVLSVRWRETADASDIAALLRSFSGELGAGPDAAGRWQVSAPDIAAAQRAILASPLVAEVVSP